VVSGLAQWSWAEPGQKTCCQSDTCNKKSNEKAHTYLAHQIYSQHLDLICVKRCPAHDGSVRMHMHCRCWPPTTVTPSS
jgi:hypothetical protein